MTHKQELFVVEYLECLNATKSALRAGYSPKTAYSIGQENLKKPEIKERIETAMAERKSESILSREQRQKFWQDVMFDEEVDMRNRLEASKLLAKSFGDFDATVIERERTKNFTLEDKIREMKI